MQEFRGRKTELVAHIGNRRVEESDARFAAAIRDKAVEPRLEPFEPGMAAHALRPISERPLGFLHGEQPQLEEAVTRQSRQKVRIAAPGVEHRAVGVARGELGEVVLKFERAEFCELGEVDRFHFATARIAASPSNGSKSESFALQDGLWKA